MSTIEERRAYLDSPYFKSHIYGNFSPFYATIAVCTALGVFLLVLNAICTCCSKHRHYWKDRHTGNRWLVSFWTATPHKQPPLDFTELRDVSEFKPIRHIEDVEQAEYIPPAQHHQHHPQPHPSRSYSQHPHTREEFVELQKRESDI
ncbi:unnamed protein product [Hermetia illucens]|uniref:Uncharacterized protein n=1 Tax=Hermetia illucens TaxID=343691 RepID=A0A7R8YRB1_HERIL|nr:uncharacterized protein LOC119649965 [Hermetia illucens]CAD7082671.1 unnamed protein product [Hermetia illucens]